MKQYGVTSTFQSGFTLSELLVALAILGVIATFTIPKILESSDTNTKKAMAKELMGALAQGHQSLKLNRTLSASTVPSDILTSDNFN